MHSKSNFFTLFPPHFVFLKSYFTFSCLSLTVYYSYVCFYNFLLFSLILLAYLSNL